MLTTPTDMATIVFWSRSMARMRGYGTLRRRGGAATLHGGEGAERKEEEWSVVSGEEEVATMAGCCAASAAARRSGWLWARRTSRAGGGGAFCTACFFFPILAPGLWLWMTRGTRHACSASAGRRGFTASYQVGPRAFAASRVRELRRGPWRADRPAEGAGGARCQRRCQQHGNSVQAFLDVIKVSGCV